MERTLCVWFPDWPLRRPGVPPGEPCLVVGSDGRVVAADPLARRAGIRPGMSRRQAELRCPGARTLPRDEGAETAAFEPVVEAVEELVPRVEVEVPGMLFVRIGGAVRYYGGEEALARRVARAVEEAAGSAARLGVADGPFAARRAAERAESGLLVVEDGSAFLGSLEVESLGRAELAATLRWLGVTTLGELARLPREAMVARFGSEGLAAHRLASGEDRPLGPRPLPEDRSVEERFEEPLTTYEQAGFAARGLVHRLMANREGLVLHRVEVEVEAARGSVRRRVWRSEQGFDEAELAERTRWQIRSWGEGTGIPGGIRRLRLIPGDLSDRGRQLSLEEDPIAGGAAGRSLARARALLGPDAILEARPQGGREPAERVRWQRWDEPSPDPERDPEAPWPGRIPGPSPGLVPPDPPHLEVEWEGGFPIRVRLGSRWVEVLSWAGPWRRLGRWWEGEGPADRYQVVTSAGAFLCEVRDGRAYLTGIYD